jgi:hypothetical protein
VFACYKSANVRHSAKVHGRGLRGAMIFGPVAGAGLALFLYLRSGGIGLFQGRTGAVPAVNLNTGKVTPPESWPKPGAELRKVDPPTPGERGMVGLMLLKLVVVR